MSGASGWLRRLARRSRWAALAAIVFLGVPVPAAEAGTYTVWSCRGPAGEPVSTAAWSLGKADDSVGAVAFDDDCAAGGELEVGLSPTTAIPPPLQPRGTATFDLPPGARIAGYTLWRSIRVAPAFLFSGYEYQAAVREESSAGHTDRGCASTLLPPLFNCSTAGNPADPLAAGNRVEPTELPLEGLQLWAGCVSSGCQAPPTAPGAEIRLLGSRVVVEETIAPSAPRLAGSLAGPGPVTGTGTLAVESTDEGSGVAAMTLSIDGGPPQTAPSAATDASCREPYALARPCPREAARTFSVDTGALAEGAHTATGTVVDAAGNVTSFGPLHFSVARSAGQPAPPARTTTPPNGVPAVTRPVLRLRRTRVRHRPGRPALIRGRLLTASGKPVAGARLDVRVQGFGAGESRERTLRPVVTSRDGRFRLVLRGNGARRVSFSFAPTVGGRPTVTSRAVVRTRASLSLARSRPRLRRGGAVVLQGRLRGAGAAARGAVVELQAIVSGRWRAVATVRAARDGRYRWRYRFRHVTRDTIFSFRALVRRTPGWPWPTLRSRRVHVRVDVG